MLKNFFHKIKSEIALFLILTVASAVILMHPSMHIDDPSFGFLDSLFTSVSALSVTGLTVRPTGSFFTAEGKWFILFLIQVGGIGIIALSSFFEYGILKRLKLSRNDPNREFSEVQTEWYRTPKFLFPIIRTIFFVQFMGFLLLLLFSNMSPFEAFFHSISAFNNAGFSVFDNNFIDFQSHIPVNIIIISLMVFGSMGFFIFVDLFALHKGKIKKLPLRSKLPLKIYTVLFLIGFITHVIDLKLGNLPVKSNISVILVSIFQSVTYRTAGFHSIDISTMGNFATSVAMVLMIIGGGSISTAGGIKMSAFYVFVRDIFAHFRGKQKVIIGKRHVISNVLVRNAIFITSSYFIVLFCSVLLLTVSEYKNDFMLIEIFYEVISAMSTVGTSLGITAELSNIGKLVIIFDMFVGRIGVYILIKGILSSIGRKEKSIKHTDLEHLDLLIG